MEQICSNYGVQPGEPELWCTESAHICKGDVFRYDNVKYIEITTKLRKLSSY